MRRALRLVGALTLLVGALVVATPLPAVLSGWLSMSALAVPADAIVVLGGGGVRDDGELTDTSLRRTHHGIALYHRGLSPLLVLSGGDSRGAPRSETAARTALARACAVSPDGIVPVSGAGTTRDEAIAVAQALRPRGVKRILLVVDAEGMSRAHRLFRNAGFDVVPAPVNEVRTMGGPESQVEVMRRVALEMVAWVYYLLGRRF